MAEQLEDSDLALFKEPEGYFKEPNRTPKQVEYQLLDGTTLQFTLLGHDILFSNSLWNAGRVVSRHLETNPQLARHKAVLELGAGAGVPSLVSALNGASTVVVTDYPDPEVIEYLCANMDRHAAKVARVSPDTRIYTRGFKWGSSPQELLSLLPETASEGFDILILADVVFSHSGHRKLMQTVHDTLRRTPDARALVFFTPYRPWLLHKDLAFFNLCEEFGLVNEKMFDTMMDKAMFDNDRGDETLRRTVFGFQIRWANLT